MDRAEPGYTGDFETGLERFLGEGVDSIADNGVFGDPRRASAEHGRRYIDRLVDLVMERVEAQSR
jgi:creatinine amidohydrolase/Fe(II)-dependent formamide hydrolase-like protein